MPRTALRATDAYVLALDGGQTATKAAVAHVDGRIVARAGVAPWDGMNSEAGRRRCRRALMEALERLLPAIPGRARCAAACLGVTSGNVGVAHVEAWLRQRVEPERLVIVPDTVTNLRGADPSGAPGVVVIAGGGSIAWGHDGRGHAASAGGHGYLLDDEGSGYEIGRQAIIAALKSSHGRRPPTVLAEAVLRHFGAPDVTAVRHLMYAGDFERSRVAGLAPAVAAAADSGDGAARSIVIAAARGLAEMAAAVIRRLGLVGAPVYPTGGVFRAGPILLEPFAAALAELAPDARVVAPVLSPLGGALVIALEQAGTLTSDALAAVASGLGSDA